MVAINKLAALGSALLNATSPALNKTDNQAITTNEITWKTLCGSGTCRFQPLYPCKWGQLDCYVFDHDSLEKGIMGERSEDLKICKPDSLACYHVRVQPHGIMKSSNGVEVTTGSGPTHEQSSALYARVSRDEWFNCGPQLCLTPSMCCGDAGCHAPPYGCPAGYNITGPPSMMDWVYTPPPDKGYHCDHQGLCFDDEPKDGR